MMEDPREGWAVGGGARWKGTVTGGVRKRRTGTDFAVQDFGSSGSERSGRGDDGGAGCSAFHRVGSLDSNRDTHTHSDPQIRATPPRTFIALLGFSCKTLSPAKHAEAVSG